MAFRDTARIISATALRALALVAGLACGAHTALAADDFYKGREFHIVISTTPGGAYDLYGRMLASVIADHIPGNPTVIVQNMPGAGGVKTANYMYTVAPRDGSVIAGTHSSVPTAPLRTPEVAKFDVNRFGWIGSITSDPFVGYVWSAATPVKTLADTWKTPVVIGGISVGTGGVDYAVMARDMFGFKLNLVTGYKGSNDVKLAMERGEVQGTFANGWSSLKSGEPTWLKEGKIRVIIQHGLKKVPDLSNVPRLIDFAKTDADRQALHFMLAIQEAAKPYFTPPAVPKERLVTLRKAFEESIRDPRFIQAADKARVAHTDPMTGEELAAFVKELSETPQSVVDRINGMLSDFKKTGSTRR